MVEYVAISLPGEAVAAMLQTPEGLPRAVEITLTSPVVLVTA